MKTVAKTWPIAGTLLLLPLLVAAEGRTLIFGNVTGWAVHTDPSRDFTCFAEARYEGNSWLRIGYAHAGSGAFLAISEPDLLSRVTAADSMVEITFDDADPVSFSLGDAEDSGAVLIDIADAQQSSFLYDFAHSYAIEVRVGDGEPLTLSLGGSVGAVKMLNECQLSMKQYSGT
jgi:hypothetical protein